MIVRSLKGPRLPNTDMESENISLEKENHLPNLPIFFCSSCSFSGDVCGCVQKYGKTPQIIHFNRVFHYKPFILGYPYFWKHPYISKSPSFSKKEHFYPSNLLELLPHKGQNTWSNFVGAFMLKLTRLRTWTTSDGNSDASVIVYSQSDT